MVLAVGRLGGNKFHYWDLACLLDYVCTHTYPKFRNFCSKQLSDLRTTYLTTFEHCLHGDLSGRNVLCEEFAGLSASRVSEEIEKEHIAMALNSLLANGSLGALYWCYSDFNLPNELPYSTSPFESHLGLVDVDGKPGAVARELKGPNFTL